VKANLVSVAMVILLEGLFIVRKALSLSSGFWSNPMRLHFANFASARD